MLLSHTSSLRDDAGYYWDAKLGVTYQDVLVPGGKHYGKGEMWASIAKPGTYFVALRGYSQRANARGTPYAMIRNLARARGVVR